MAIGLDLYTVGNIDTIAEVYKYLHILLGTHFVGYITKTMVIWGLLFAILASVFQGRFHTWIYHFLASYFVYTIFFMPVVTLTIHDEELNKTYPVSGVPFGIGFIASMASTFSYEMTKKIEEVFHDVPGPVIVWTPETGGQMVSYNTQGIGFLHTGYAGIFNYLKMGLEINPKLVENKFSAIYEMDSYIQQCFIPYAASMDQTQLNNLLKSNDLLKSIEVKSSFFMSYDGQTWTCNNFYTKLKTDWKKFVDSVSDTKHNGEYALGLARYMVKHIVDSVNAMSNASLKFNQIVSQDGIISMMREDYFSGLTSDMNNRILAGYIVGRAEAKSKLYGEAMFLWASKVVPTLQAFLEDFFVILFPFLIILIFLPLVSFGGIRAAVGYLKVIAWVYLITPVLAIIDALIKLEAIEKTTAWLQSVHLSGITLGDYGYLLNQADFYPAVAGVAAMSSPLWAWMLLQGFETGVMGMAELVGSIGTQFIGQGVLPQNLTSNIARDSREIQAGIQSGQSSLEALSNAGTWMFKQNADLAGMYNSVAGYNEYSVMENQLGVGGTLQATMEGALYQTLLIDGKGMSYWKVTGGNIFPGLQSGALEGKTITEAKDFGLVKLTYDLNGKLQAAEVDASMGSNMFKTNLQFGISQAKTYALSTMWNELFGKGESYQKAMQATIATTYQFLKAFGNREGIQEIASITKSAEDKQSFAESISLAHQISSIYHLSDDKSTQFVATLGAALSEAAAKNGGSLSEAAAKSIFFNILSKFVPGVEGKGTHTYQNSQIWNDAQNYIHSRAYQHTQSFAMQYAISHKGFFEKMKQEVGSELHGVTLQDLRQYSQNWQTAEQFSHTISENLSQIQTQAGNLTLNSLPGFLNWMTGGDKVAEAKMLVAIDEAAYHNNVKFFQELGQMYADYTMHMQGMKDISSKVDNFLANEKKNFVETIKSEVHLGTKNVETYYQGQVNNLKTKYFEPYKVDPSQSLKGEINSIFGVTRGNINTIKEQVIADKSTIHKPVMSERDKKAQEFTKGDVTSPFTLDKNIGRYLWDHPGTGAGALLNLSGPAIGALLYKGEQKLWGKIKDLKVGTELTEAGGEATEAGEVGLETVGTSFIPGVGEIVAGGLILGAGYEAIKWFNKKYEHTFYEKVVKPYEEKTGQE